MDIRNIRGLRAEADRALAKGREPKKVIGGYVVATALIWLAVMAIDYILDVQLSKSGGLSDLGVSALLSTVQLILPLAQTVIILALTFGFQSALLRISRGQYADHTDLKTGFQRFWPLIRLHILQLSLYLALCFALVYPCTAVYLMTPFADEFWALSETLTVIDEAAMEQLSTVLQPMMIIFTVIYAFLCLPIYFRFRMANYILLDKPHVRPILALRESSRMMRGNRLQLFKVDLHLWLYHSLNALLLVISYGNLLLPMAGIELPWSADVSYYIFTGIYLIGTLAVYYFLRNRAEMTYIRFYEALRPEEPPRQGVVLGNIFQM
ncbi:MAG: DUF975 family protein [Oscillospiraceae bacterium]|nr:DUF975 family protein [Oscillospiraceae bacterium]